MTLHARRRAELLGASRAELKRAFTGGAAVDPAVLTGFCYRGTSLGLPRVVERAAWKTFQKAFWRHPEHGLLVGWNVRLHQDGVDAPSRPRMRGGVPVTTWFYQVFEHSDAEVPDAWLREFPRGLMLDYTRGPNALFDGVHGVRDPLVDVGDGSGALLLGLSTVTLAGLCVRTPTYFLLEREGPIAYVPERARAWRARRTTPALLAFERRIAEQIFDALLGVDERAGARPAFSSLPHDAFWSMLEAHTPPYFGPGLRATVHALNAAPLVLDGVRRPLSSLPRAERVACLERLAQRPSVALKQMMATAKILACFAYFEHDAVRALAGRKSTTQPQEPSCAA